MNKMPMCRICLVDNVRMYIVNDKDLQELYEKLTDIPFLTEDSRPMLACFICCTKLKQCCQLQRKCLEAEMLFAQMMNEPNLSVNRGQLNYSSGLTVTPVEIISIVDVSHVESIDVSHVESIAVKEELPADCERLDDVIVPEEEHFKYELELKLLNNSYSDVEGIPAQQSKPEPGYDVPLIEIKVEEVEEEQEVSLTKQRASDTTHLKLENVHMVYSDVENTLALHCYESSSEDDVPLTQFKIEVEDEQEIPRKERRASDTTRAAAVKKQTQHVPGKNLEDIISRNRKKNEESVTKVTQNTQKLTSELIPQFQEPLNNTTPRVFDTTSDTNCCNNIKKPNLTNHTRIRTSGGPHKCDICQYSSKNKAGLTRHNRVHTGEKPFKCEYCQKCFSNKSTLIHHIRTHTSEKPYECEECQLCFSQKSALIRHFRTHTGERPYKCEECQLCYSRKFHLIKHISFKHAGEKPFKCEYCQRCFNKKSNLTIHVRRHTGEKPFKCEYCQRCFSDNKRLTSHIRTHTGERPFKCEYCQKCFGSKSTLTTHIRTHTSEKPYKCEECQLCFSQKSALVRHIRTHTGEKPYKCEECQVCYTQKFNLMKHIRHKHAGEKLHK